MVDPRGPVFISYRHSDGANTALSLAWALRAAGVPVWHDQADLPPGDTDRRLDEALRAGLSGAVLLITPEIVHSRVVRELELPSLLKLERNPAFTLAVASTIEDPERPGQLDYTAPDRLLGQQPNTLARLNQQRAATRADHAKLAAAFCRRRMEQLRADIEANGGELTLDLQTRVRAFAARARSDLVVRLRPPAHGMRHPPSEALNDLQLFLEHLPQLLEIAHAASIRVRGGAHVSVACALGAALPTTLTGSVEVLDTQATAWRLVGQAPSPGEHRLLEAVEPPTSTSARGPVLVYADLLPQPSDAAFQDLVAANNPSFAQWMHVRPRQHNLIVAANASSIVGELNAAIRELADRHRTTEVHLLLRCPFPVTLLVGRTLNTLTVRVYEWEDAPDVDGAVNGRYIPTLLLRSGAGGSPIMEITVPALPVTGL